MTMPTAPDRHPVHRSGRRAVWRMPRGDSGRRWRKRAAAILLGTTVPAMLAGAGVAQAAPSDASLWGADVSYPQCGAPLPTGQAFGVVGVNGGTADSTDPCLATELAWAAGSTGGTVHDDIQLYVNTGNPGTGAASWPQSGSNRYGDCDGSDSVPCAYQYGWDRARDDATVRGITDPEQYMWWLDVEIANSWDYTEGGATRNAAVLEGMTEYFTSIGVREVGLYSTAHQWGEIVGTGMSATSSLIGLPNWRPAGSDLAAAQATCGVAPLTPGGVVELTQYATDFDYIHSCI
jgi:hypothetical protein